MDRLSAKIEIINHFDNMINRVDIEIEDCLVKYKEEQTIGYLEYIRNERNFKFPLCFHLCFFPSSSKKDNNQSMEVLPSSTKVVDYLNQVRKRTIDELRKAQKDSITHYNSISTLFKQHVQLTERKELEDIRSQLFGEKFYFQVLNKPNKEEKVEKTEKEKKWIFNLYTIVTDFYMSSADINLLE
jgi:hypothetical protein